MSERRYNIYLSVEEVTVDEDGNDQDWETIEEEMLTQLTTLDDVTDLVSWLVAHCHELEYRALGE